MLRVYLLGPMELRRGEDPLPIPPTQKSQSLLAYLITHRDRPQPRPRLIDLFWDESSERRARRSLSTALWHIRRALDDPARIRTEGDTVQFDARDDFWLDAAAFEEQVRQHQDSPPDGPLSEGIRHLQRAIDLYRGDFLAGFYDDWCISERYRLEGLLFDALARLMAAYEARGEYRAALATAQHLLRLDPLREDAHRLAMRACASLGQRNAALTQYQRCRETLQRELAAEPVSETEALYQAILEGRWDAQPLSAEHPADPPALWESPLPPVHPGRTPFDPGRTSLVGREEELDALLGHWGRCVAGQGRLVLLEGEAGIGKTSLAQALAQNVRWRGGQVIWSHCYEHERSFPYQPLVEATRLVLPSLTDAELEAIPAQYLAEVAQFVPELSERCPNLPTPAAVDPARQQAWLSEAISQSLLSLSRRTALLLLLEDLHWAADSVVQFLHYLTRHLASAHILVVGTFRGEEVPSAHPLRDLARRRGREGLVAPLALARLRPEAVQALLGELSGLGEAVAPLARRLYQETEGNPFFLTEMIKVLFEDRFLQLQEGVWHWEARSLDPSTPFPLPPTVEELLQARVGRLPQEAQETLRLAAVAGPTFDFDLLRVAGKTGVDQTLEAIDDLLRHQLIVENEHPDGRDYTFTHHLIQEVVYQGLHQHRRQHLHRRVGQAMEDLYAGQPALASQLAYHSVQAAEWNRALPLLVQAAEEAASAFAFDEALAHYRRALEALPLLEGKGADEIRRDLQEAILSARAEIHHLLGRQEARQADLAQLRQAAEATSDPARLAHALEREARYLNLDGHYDEALARAKQAVDLFRQAGYASGEGMALAQWGFAHYFLGQHQAALEPLQKALTLEPMDPQTRGEVLSVLSYVHYLVAQYAQALEYRQQALALRRSTGQQARVAEDLTDMGILHTHLQNHAQARRYLEEALELARAIGSQPAESYALNNTGNLLYILGDYEAALGCYHDSLDLQRATGSRRGEASCLNNIGMTLLQVGLYEEAAEALEQALDINKAIGYRSGTAEALCHQAQVLSAQGQAQQAEGSARQALDLAREIGDRYGQVLALNTLAALNLKGGKPSLALTQAEEAIQVTEATAWHGGAVQGWTYLGLAHLARGETQAARSCTEKAIRLLESCQAVEGPEEEVYFAHAQALRAAGAEADADTCLQLAREEVKRKAAALQEPRLREGYLKRQETLCPQAHT